MGNRRYFEDLDRQARLADLEIETMRVDQLSALDTKTLTLGQLIMLANVVEAVRILQDFPSIAEASSPADGGIVEEAENVTREAPFSYFSPDTPVPTVGGPVLYKDIPRDENGIITAGWIDENCTCDDHEKSRIDKAKESGDSIARGLYL